VHTRRLFLQLTAGCAVLDGSRLFAAVRGDEVMYVWGTTKAIPDKSEGRLDTSNETFAKFVAKNGSLTISYKGITSLEYGQKAGRRVGAVLAVSLIALFTRKRRHYLTVGYTDEQGKRQGAIFEIAKGRVRAVAVAFETRSGKKINFESDEARKHFEGK
jgi:hypothetical protein